MLMALTLAECRPALLVVAVVLVVAIVLAVIFGSADDDLPMD